VREEEEEEERQVAENLYRPKFCAEAVTTIPYLFARPGK
jgi:hypothetical protein